MSKKSTKITDGLDIALSSLSKTWGAGFNTRGLADAKYEAIPTGYDDLDEVLTKGSSGIYRGGICEISGSEGSGKTSIAMRTVGNAQKMGLNALWIDAESTFSPDLAQLNGCDPSKIIMPELNDTKAIKDDEIHFLNVSEILQMIYQATEQGVFGVVVLDSVAALMPESVLQMQTANDSNKLGMAEVARAMSRLLPKISAVAAKTSTAVIFINQLREKPGEMFVKADTPGGRALKFFATQRIKVDRIKGKGGEVTHSSEDGQSEIIGHYARSYISKNKKAPPVHHPIEIPIYYKEYFPDKAKRCYDVSRALNVVKIRQGVLTWKDYDGEKILQSNGESTFLEEIRTRNLESRLAYSCVQEEGSERNKRLKQPIKVPKAIKNLSNDYLANANGKTASTDKSPNKVTAAISLDD